MNAASTALLILAALLAGCASTGPANAPVQPAAEAEAAPPPNSAPEPTRPPLMAIPPAAPGDAEARRRLLRLIPADAPDRPGWATDILAAFSTLRLPATPENFCAAIAVIEQESSFRADPTVPGLPRLVWGEIERRRQKYLIPKVLLDAALLKSSPDGRSYKARIDALRTERQMNDLFQAMIAELPYGRTLLAGYNPVRTGGPMQVSVDFAEDHSRRRGYPYPVRASIRDEVFTRHGGVFFGVAILLDYPAPYSQPLYRFADFNAGRYSSRNAAFQNAVARLTKKRLVVDGDLLRYENGAASAQPSQTQVALNSLSARLGMRASDIRRDLGQEKSAAFADTPLDRKVFALADRASPLPAPREVMPRIALKSPKITRRLTTEWFAKRVDGRYRNCLARNRLAV